MKHVVMLTPIEDYSPLVETQLTM